MSEGTDQFSAAEAAVDAIRQHIPTLMRLGCPMDRDFIRVWNRARVRSGLPPLGPEFDLELGSALGHGVPLLRLDESEARPEPEWLVGGLLPRGGLGVLFGLPGVGKTFLAMDLAFRVALGRDWFGHRTVPGPVAYVVGEGAGMFQERTIAWRRGNGVPRAADIDLYIHPGPVNLTREEEVTDFLAKAAGLDLVLVVFDTLSRSMGGADENSPVGMTAAIGSMDRIRAAGPAVLDVHHTPKDGRDARGHSSLEGAADLMLRVADRRGRITLEVTKVKEAEPPPSWGVRLVRSAGSLVVANAGEVPSAEPDRLGDCGAQWSAGRRDRQVLEALAQFGEQGATSGQWQQACHVRGVNSRAFYEARRILVESGLVANPQRGRRGSHYRLTDEGRRQLSTADTADPSLESDRSGSLAHFPAAPLLGGGGRAKEPNEVDGRLGPAWGTEEHDEEDRQ